MTSYVLVHGGMHGAWCWESLVPLLEGRPGVDRVVALDLVGHGERLHEKSASEITLDDYVDDIAGVITTMDLHDVVLVAHSMAGASAPQAAARVAERIRRIVFLAALIPEEGRSARDMTTEEEADRFRAASGSADLIREMLCTDEDEETTRRHLGRLTPEPRGAMRTRVRREGFPPDLPVTYILLGRDTTLAPQRQREMIENLGGRPEIMELDAGHPAMITHPAELAEILLRYA